MSSELGDLLFAITNLARKLDLDAEHALREATDRFGRRFRYMEERLEAEGRPVKSATPEEQNALWEEAKKAEPKKEAPKKAEPKKEDSNKDPYKP